MFMQVPAQCLWPHADAVANVVAAAAAADDNNLLTLTAALCRSPRSLCDLTAASMTASTPNAGPYTIEVRTGDALEGCLASGSTTCPATYPFQTTGANGLVTCRYRHQLYTV
jgi:hypothetical protein